MQEVDFDWGYDGGHCYDVNGMELACGLKPSFNEQIASRTSYEERLRRHNSYVCIAESRRPTEDLPNELHCIHTTQILRGNVKAEVMNYDSGGACIFKNIE